MLTIKQCLPVALSLAMSPLWACGTPIYNPTAVTGRASAMDTEVFASALIAILGETPNKGWSATLRNKENLQVATVNHGLARTACDEDGAQAFTSATETPWGSVSKLITTASALRVAKLRNVSLDEPLVEHLPYRWRNLVHNRIELGENGSGPVTLRMMLQHRGGFHHSSCFNRNIKDRLIDGDMVNCGTAQEPNWPPAVGQRSYANMSQAIFQIALAYMDNPLAMNFYEVQWDDIPIANYDAQIQAITNAFYVNYVKDNLFAPIGITGTCDLSDVASVPGSNYTLWYSNAADTSGTAVPNGSSSCAAGAWSMSSGEMSYFLNRLKFGNLIDADSYALMEQGSLDSLGWWKSDWSIGTVYSHNGAWGNTRSEVRALPGGYTATLVTNSAPYDILATALNEAAVASRVKGISDIHSVLYRQ